MLYLGEMHVLFVELGTVLYLGGDARVICDGYLIKDIDRNVIIAEFFPKHNQTTP